MLSIIIPHYNSPQTLGKLLGSIPDTDWIEVIVVDDKSTRGLDAYGALKQEYAAKARFYDNTTHIKSAGTCRNIGIEKATGEWLMFADADDYFLPGFCENVGKYLESCYDVVFFRLASADLITGEQATRHLSFIKILDNYINNKGRAEELKLRYGLPYPFAKLIRAALLEENHIRFDETIVANDVMLSVKVGHSMSKFHVAEEELYCITASSGTLTTDVDEEKYLLRPEVGGRVHSFLRSVLSEEEYKSLHFSAMIHLLNGFIGGYKLKTILKAVRIYRKNRIPLFAPGRYFTNPVEFFLRIGGLIKKLFAYIGVSRRYTGKKAGNRPK